MFSTPIKFSFHKFINFFSRTFIIQYGTCSHTGTSGRSVNVTLPTAYGHFGRTVANRVSTDSSASGNVTCFIRIVSGQADLNTKFTCVFSESNMTAYWVSVGV